MSIRILPAPAKVHPFFDDGIVPLSAKAIDEDYYLAPKFIVAPPIVPVYTADDPIMQVVVSTIFGDDVPDFRWPAPPLAAGKYFVINEADELANAANFPGDESIGMQTIVTADKVMQLGMYIDEDVLPVTATTTILFRNTLSGIGGRAGQRQLQGF